MSFLSNLDWRYAVKNFDTTKKVSEENLNSILEAARKAPTSYGIMPYRIIRVKNSELRTELKAVSWNQPQIDSASDLLVFIARTDLETISEEFFSELSDNNDETRAGYQGYEDMVNGFISRLPEENRITYSAEQAYLAAGFALAAAAELKIDSCPIGGFDATKYQEILGLEDYEIPVMVMAIGYRDEAKEHQRPKFRIAIENLVTTK